jgi:cytidylate kinase
VTRRRILVAIDGAAGSGKSTLAELLARDLGLPYVNTGLMYRALAAAAARASVDSGEPEALLDLARGLRFVVRGGARGRLEVEGYSAEELTSRTVESTVSAVARHPAVRRWMRDAQRALGADGAVMEGRDIGTVVFPDADVKLFLRADANARAQRRALERDGGEGDVGQAMHRRDERDARTTPLEPASDAVVIDTGDLDIEGTLAVARAIVEERVGKT